MIHNPLFRLKKINPQKKWTGSLWTIWRKIPEQNNHIFYFQKIMFFIRVGSIIWLVIFGLTIFLTQST